MLKLTIASCASPAKGRKGNPDVIGLFAFGETGEKSVSQCPEALWALCRPMQIDHRTRPNGQGRSPVD